MMLELFAFIHLPEDCGRVIKSFHLPSYEEARIFKGHRVGKRKLRPWKDANTAASSAAANPRVQVQAIALFLIAPMIAAFAKAWWCTKVGRRCGAFCRCH